MATRERGHGPRFVAGQSSYRHCDPRQRKSPPRLIVDPSLEHISRNNQRRHENQLAHRRRLHVQNAGVEQEDSGSQRRQRVLQSASSLRYSVAASR